VTAHPEGRRGAGSRVSAPLLLLLLAIPSLLRAQVDTLTREQLYQSGRSALSEVLRSLVPALNLSRPSNSGASDAVRPVSLSGLGADQLVVLVNGKRRLESALLDLSETIGRGQATVDLDAIPVSAIERVEVHRGGDAARYGFGAVAGVIDIVLLGRSPDAATVQAGTTTTGDGTVLLAGGHRVMRLGRGFVQLAAQVRSQGATNRALPDPRQQYFNGDPRNAAPPRVDERFGDPESQELMGVLNAEQALFRRRVTAYGFATWSHRSAESGELFRRPSDDRTVRALYPGGYVPLFAPKLSDGSVLAGLRGSVLRFGWDASIGYARNAIHYQLENSANVSLGRRSPSRFDAGSLRADQFSVGLELSRRIAPGGWLPPFSLELGGQHRSDGYQIEPGEPDSYRYGGVPIQDGPHAGGLAEPGAQGFPGFRPNDAVITRRGMVAGYGSLSTVVLRRVSLAAAVRAEYYPKLGTLDVYQLSGRLAPWHGVELFGYAGTGVRVPSLSQAAFSSSATRIVESSGFDDRTVPVRDPLADVLGIPALGPEHSRHAGMGAGWSGRGLRLGADLFAVTVRDRIILSGSFDDPSLQFFLAQQHFPGIGSVRFFANALRTRTTGLEASASYRVRVAGTALQFDGALEHHTTRVTRADSITGLLRPFASVFFGRVERARIERGQPGDNLLLSAEAARGAWTLLARSQRFGSVTSLSGDGTQDQSYGAKWLSDVSLSYRFRALTVQAGADNLFRVYPDRNRFGDANSEGNSHFGMFAFSDGSPFGFSGRLVYLRAVWQPDRR